MIKKAIIVEDEEINTQVLIRMLERYPDIEIVGEAKSREEAKILLSRSCPDVIFLDILLPDGSGFDILPYVDDKTQIIFTTGHGNYAVQAFDINAVDYLLKPFSHERLAMAIRKVSMRRLSEKANGEAKDPEFRIKVDQLMIKTDAEYRFVRYSDILSVVSEGGNYTSVQYQGHKSTLLRKTLKEWEEMLPAEQFIRIHRSGIINASKITHLIHESGLYFVSIEGIEKRLQVSRRHVAVIKKLMKSSS